MNSSEKPIPPDSNEGQEFAETNLGSDWFQYHSETELAPSFPGVFRSRREAEELQPPEFPAGESQPGEGSAAVDHGDFMIHRELGRGTSGVVYLARQVSLSRNVALKVTRNVGSEAQTMASLEHRHIVQVFSEALSRDEQLRLICMQYVPGITLADLIERLPELITGDRRQQFHGGSIAEVARGGPLEDDPGENLVTRRSTGYVEAVCELIARVADALDYAHQQGVLHLDVKPANILIDKHGHPVLADFSLSTHEAFSGLGVVGGTLAYMAPEHLRAFAARQPSSDVDQRADIYSLGLIFYELLTLERWRQPATEGLSLPELCCRLADHRTQQVPSISRQAAKAVMAVNWTLARCLSPDPNDRFSSAAEFAAAVRGCQQLEPTVARIEEKPITKAARKYPFVTPLVLGTAANLLPFFIGAAYAASTRRGIQTLAGSVPLLTLAWAILLALLASMVNLSFIIGQLRPIVAAFNSDSGIELNVAGLRHKIVRFPLRAVVVDLLTWLPGPIVSVAIFLLLPSGISLEILADLLIGYSIILIIVLSSMYYIAACYGTIVYYPTLWTDARNFRSVAARELRDIPGQLRCFQLLAAIVPITAAIGLVLLGPDHFASNGYFTFRVLAVSLIALGTLGLMATGRLREEVIGTIRLFTGQDD